MIKVYYRGSCGSSRRAFAWFEKYNIDVEKQQISKMTRSDLIKLLQHSDEGLKSIVKRPGRAAQKLKMLYNIWNIFPSMKR
ncbi:hypothetical protein ikelab_17040 [Lactococcus garvieae]|uniref:Arsenate reductase n=1 Tax=Lactococcus garvieae TaxID=1363 RepID=A0A6L2ZWF9_9LACT|nr:MULTISPECIES: hypothetical protein [Lactococcus]GFO52429.1 hypothetical protein ikelab_17040 [Lactococcus garvieae]